MIDKVTLLTMFPMKIQYSTLAPKITRVLPIYRDNGLLPFGVLFLACYSTCGNKTSSYYALITLLEGVISSRGTAVNDPQSCSCPDVGHCCSDCCCATSGVASGG
jgi:hypothetical protein